MTTLKRPRHDTVFLRKLSTRAIVGPDRWHNRHIQPVEISIEMSKKERIVTRAGDDNVDISIRYDMVEAAVSKAITSKATFDNLPQLVEAIYQATDAQINVACSVTIAMTVKLPKGLLLTDGVGYSTVWESTASLSLSESFCPATGRPIANTCVFVENLRASCVIGMLAQERPESQAVIINLWFYNEDYRVLETVLQELSEYVIVLSKIIEGSNYATLEALANSIANYLLTRNGAVETVTVAISKPSALTFVEHAGVEITRSLEDFS